MKPKSEASPTHRLQVPLSPQALRAILKSHGWVHLDPVLVEKDGFSSIVTLSPHKVARIDVQAHDNFVSCSVDQVPTKSEQQVLAAMLDRILSLHFDLDGFIQTARRHKSQHLATLAMKGWGRMFRSATPWEDAVKTLLTTNASWAYTIQMTQRLCSCLGAESSSAKRAFPLPQSIIKMGCAYLSRRVRVGYRAKSLLALARRGTTVPWMTDISISPSHDEVLAEVESWPGFGPYATKHFMMLMGYHRYVPVDREVANFMGVREVGSKKRVEHLVFYEDWGDYAFTAYKLTRVWRRQNWIGD